jgi:hypothetical protein
MPSHAWESVKTQFGHNQGEIVAMHKLQFEFRWLAADTLPRSVVLDGIEPFESVRHLVEQVCERAAQGVVAIGPGGAFIIVRHDDFSLWVSSAGLVKKASGDAPLAGTAERVLSGAGGVSGGG